MQIDPEVESLIAGTALSAHLATSVDDRPHVAPAWYVYEDGSLWVLAGGKKLANVRRNPRVPVSIERYDGDGVDWGVQLLGTARVVPASERLEHVRRRMGEVYSGPYGSDGGRQPEPVAVEGPTEDGYDWALIESAWPVRRASAIEPPFRRRRRASGPCILRRRRAPRGAQS